MSMVHRIPIGGNPAWDRPAGKRRKETISAMRAQMRRELTAMCAKIGEIQTYVGRIDSRIGDIKLDAYSDYQKIMAEVGNFGGDFQKLRADIRNADIAMSNRVDHFQRRVDAFLGKAEDAY